MTDELLGFLVRTERPSVAGIVLLAVFMVQPVWFAAEKLRGRKLAVRTAVGLGLAALFFLLVKIPGGYFFGLAPLLALNVWLWLRGRDYRAARRALEQEVETRFLDLPARRNIETMIREVEKASAAELRVLVEIDFPGDPVERAKLFYRELRMDRTEGGTGVLFYFCIRQKRFAIWGAVDSELASKAASLGEEAFRQAKFGDGIVAMIGDLLDHLAARFPPRPNDRNELEDRVIVLL